MTGLPAKIVRLHEALDAGHVPHAFGGALALAWCTAAARGTIDVNIFLDAGEVGRLQAALPSEVPLVQADQDLLRRDGQARLWWDRTPVDVFFDTTPFHEQVGTRVRRHDVVYAPAP